MNSPQRTHEVRLRGLSGTGGCHAIGIGSGPGQERMNSPLEGREVRLRGLSGTGGCHATGMGSGPGGG